MSISVRMVAIWNKSALCYEFLALGVLMIFIMFVVTPKNQLNT